MSDILKDLQTETITGEVMPRPEFAYTHKLDKHILDSVSKWTSNGISKRGICNAIGIHRDTLNTWLNRGRKNLEAFDMGEIEYLDVYGQFYINYNSGRGDFEETKLGQIDVSKDWKAHVWRLQQVFKEEKEDNYKDETNITITNKYSEYTSEQLKAEVIKKLGIIGKQDENPLGH